MATTIHRISEEFLEDSFDLIAMHCNMECYAMAYHINSVVNISLERAGYDLEISSSSYPIYEYRDDVKGEEWYLINNVLKDEANNESDGLFQDSTTIRLNYLLEERKEINYLLKLYPEMSIDIERAIKAIRAIPKVSMAYRLDVDDLKSKRNLIF